MASRRVIGVAQVDSSTLELPRAYSVGVVQRTLYLELLGRTLLFVVGVVCAYSMFGVARRTLGRCRSSGLQHWSCLFVLRFGQGLHCVRRWSCLCVLYVWSCQAYSRWSCLCVLYFWSCQAYSSSELCQWTPVLELLVQLRFEQGLD